MWHGNSRESGPGPSRREKGEKKEATEVEGCRDTRHRNFCTKMSPCDDACTMTTHNGHPKEGRSGGRTNFMLRQFPPLGEFMWKRGLKGGGGLQGSAAPAGCGVPQQALSWPRHHAFFPSVEGGTCAHGRNHGERRGDLPMETWTSFKTFQLCKLHKGPNTLRHIVTKEQYWNYIWRGGKKNHNFRCRFCAAECNPASIFFFTIF